MEEERSKTNTITQAHDQYASADERSKLLLTRQGAKIAMISVPRLLNQFLIMLLAFVFSDGDSLSINFLRVFCYFILAAFTSAIFEKIYPYSFNRDKRNALSLDACSPNLTQTEATKAIEDLKAIDQRESLATYVLPAVLTSGKFIYLHFSSWEALRAAKPINELLLLFYTLPLINPIIDYFKDEDSPTIEPAQIKKILNEIISNHFSTQGWETKGEQQKLSTLWNFFVYFSGMNHTLKIRQIFFSFKYKHIVTKNRHDKTHPPETLINLFIGSWLEEKIPNVKVFAVDERTIILAPENNNVFEELNVEELKKDFERDLSALKKEWREYCSLKKILDEHLMGEHHYSSQIEINEPIPEPESEQTSEPQPKNIKLYQLQVQISYNVANDAKDPLNVDNKMNSYLSSTCKITTQAERQNVKRTFALKEKTKPKSVADALRASRKTSPAATTSSRDTKQNQMTSDSEIPKSKEPHFKRSISKRHPWFFSPDPPKSFKKFSPYLLINHENSIDLASFETAEQKTQRDWTLLYLPNHQEPFAIGIFRVDQDQFQNEPEMRYSTFHDIFLQKNVVQKIGPLQPGIEFENEQLVIKNASNIRVRGHVNKNTFTVHYVYDSGKTSSQKEFKPLWVVDFNTLVYGRKSWINSEPLELEVYFHLPQADDLDFT